MKLLFDPRIMNFIIMGMYVLNGVRWAVAGSWWNVMYWICAFGITASVTFGIKH